MKTAFRKNFVLRILAITCFTFPSLVTQCQTVTFDWAKRFGSPGLEFGISLVIDSNKYVLSAGHFHNTIDFDPGAGVFNLTAVSYNDMYILKTDTAGNFIWAKQIGGPGLSGVFLNLMTADAVGNLYFSGTFQSTVDFDPGPGIHNVTAINGVNTFILKLDRDGNFIWVKTLVTNGNPEISVNDPNDVVIIGEFTGTVDFDPGPGTYNANTGSALIDDIYVLKLDMNGNFVWMKQLHGNAQNTVGVAPVRMDPAKNIYIAGTFTQTIDFDPGTNTTNLTSAGLTDMFILKLDKDGNFVWVKQVGGTGDDGAAVMELDLTNNICIAGSFAGATDFDSGSGSYILTAPATNPNTFILKLDINGNFIFARQFVSSDQHTFVTSMALDWNNDIYLHGNYGGVLGSFTDFDPGPGTFFLYNGSIFITKLNSAGNFQWAKPLISTGSFAIYISDIKTDILKNVYSLGSFYGTVDFDPDPPVYPLTSVGNTDIYLHKMSQCRNTLNTIAASSCSNYTLNGITYTSSGTYYQMLPNAVGCDSIIALNLTILKVSTLIKASVCQGEFYGSYGTTGIYVDTFMTASGCDSIRTLDLTVNNDPHPYLGNDTGVCSGRSILLNPGNFSSYSWDNGTTAPTLNVSNPGIYWVIVKDVNNCAATDSINISPGVSPVIKAQRSNDINCNFSSAVLSVSGAAAYTWSPAIGLDNIHSANPVASPAVTTKYFVTGQDQNGCEGKDSITVAVVSGGRINQFYMANSFTPNGDGVNDCYGINYSGSMLTVEFIIYNRWGEKVFSTNNPSNCWDGLYKSKKPEPGAYVYYIKGNTSCGPIEKKGTFILIR